MSETSQGSPERATSGTDPDDAKLAELILLITRLSDDDPSFGSTKLNKLLFFADFEAYVLLGRAITWQEYQCLDQVPAPRNLLPVRAELIDRGDLIVRELSYFDLQQKRPVAVRDPDLSRFSAEEVMLTVSIVKRWRGRSAGEISATSHDFVGWRLASRGETIPYETALAEPHDVTAAEEAQAAELAGAASKALAAV